MKHHLPHFYEEDHLDSLVWDGWRAGFLPGIRVTEAYIHANEIIPGGWGIAYRDWMTDTAIVMPIPFNLVARAILRIKRWVKVPKQSKEAISAYERGLKQGQDQGRAMGYNAGFVDGSKNAMSVAKMVVRGEIE